MAAGIEVRPYAGVGAEVLGIDLSGDLPDDLFEQVRQAFVDHGVVFFRDQQLSREQHIGFARRWGDIVVNRFFVPDPGFAQIAEVRKEPQATANIGGGWHTDHSYDAEPAMGSVLVARALPARGGDTMFASMYAAYDALSDGMKRTLSSLNAVHSSRHVFGRQGAYDDGSGRSLHPDLATQDSVHPVVITHPLSHRKALYVNPGFTRHFEGWTAEESEPLLQQLYRHAARPEFTTRFQWRPGSVAFWDNRATWHYALNDYPGQQRLMHRITIAGGPLGR
ncbi:MAG: TauD/TfdA family dioxygenase [Burkholderiaceae bacterium]